MADRPQLFMLSVTTITGLLTAVATLYHGDMALQGGMFFLVLFTFFNTVIIGYDRLTEPEGLEQTSQ